jgi:GntR family transcriptional regulator
MDIRISSKESIPIYLQIVNQIKYMVAAGRLTSDDEMPPIRKLAEQLLINPNTVARAYRELERDGVLVSRQGAGTRIATPKSPFSEDEKTRILTERADALLVEADQLGVPVRDVIHLIEERDEVMNSRLKEKKV